MKDFQLTDCGRSYKIDDWDAVVLVQFSSTEVLNKEENIFQNSFDKLKTCDILLT